MDATVTVAATQDKTCSCEIPLLPHSRQPLGHKVVHLLVVVGCGQHLRRDRNAVTELLAQHPAESKRWSNFPISPPQNSKGTVERGGVSEIGGSPVPGNEPGVDVREGGEVALRAFGGVVGLRDGLGDQAQLLHLLRPAGGRHPADRSREARSPPPNERPQLDGVQPVEPCQLGLGRCNCEPTVVGGISMGACSCRSLQLWAIGSAQL